MVVQRKVEIVIGAKDLFSRNITRAQKLAKKLGASFASLGRIAKKGALVATAAIGAITAALVIMTQRTVAAGDEVHKMGLRIGVSTEALSEYRHVAELSGVTFTNLTIGWQRQTRRIAEAAQGFGEAKGALKELGLVAEELVEKSPDEQFEIIAASIMEVKNSSDRVRLAMKLWDSEGVSLLQTMENGTEGLKAMRAEAHALGIVFSAEDAAASVFFKDTVTRLGTAIQGTTKSISLMIIRNNFVIKSIELAQNQFIAATKWVNTNREALMEWSKTGIIAVVKGVKFAVQAIQVFSNAWNGLKIVGSAALVLLADKTRILFELFKALLLPLDLIFDGMVKIGAIKVNPFDKAREVLDTFQRSSRDVLNETLDGAIATNDAYAVVGTTLDSIIVKLGEIPAATAAAKEAAKDIGEDEEGGRFVLTPEIKAAREGLEKQKDPFAAMEPEDPFAKHQIELDNLALFLEQRKELLMTAGLSELEAEAALVDNKLALANKERQLKLKIAESVGTSLVSGIKSFAKISGKENKKMFKITQATGAAQATVNAWVAATEALRTPWPASLAAWASALSQGLSAVAAIKGVSAGGGGGGGGAGRGGGGGVPSVGGGFRPGAIPTAPEAVEQLATQQIKIDIINPLSEGNWEAIGEDIVKSINSAGKRNVVLEIDVIEPIGA